MALQIEACISTTVRHLQKVTEEERDLELVGFFGNFTLDFIARCAFGTRLDSHSDKTNDFVACAKKLVGQKISLPLITYFLLPGVAKFFRMTPVNPATLEYFRGLIQRVMKDRADSKTRQEDFLLYMIDARQGICAQGGATVTPHTYERTFDVDSMMSDPDELPSQALSEDEAMAQCFMFIIVGQRTTVSLIAFTLYMLALLSEVQEKLREEVDLCVKKHGENPALEVVVKLEYLHGVISETLRMFPPFTRLERQTVQDYVLGDTGIEVPKGCVVAVPLYAMHHDPEYFPEPYTFRPERFIGENANEIQRYMYLPFGAGPRNCVGMKLALHAAKMAVMHSVRTAQFVRTDNTKIPLHFFKGFGVMSCAHITVGVQKRSPKNEAPAH